MVEIVDDDGGELFESVDDDVIEDSAVSMRETTLLRNMRKHLANVKMRECDTCHERGFKVHIRDGDVQCRRCLADKRDDGKLWSNANNVNPCMLILMFDAFLS
jgi:hypothetical protein